MTAKKLFFKPNVVVEPLVNQWYAWSYLISPATSAIYINAVHLKIMQSFISNPEVHISALKDPEMVGGPFIDYDESRVDNIRNLMHKTIIEQADSLKLAEAIKTLEKNLIEQAQGYTLEPFYHQVPEILKGYVELVYDLNNNPSIRFIEGLMYKTSFYNQSGQSVALSLIDSDKRSFAFSTPRLNQENYLHLNISFNNQALDELFKMKNLPHEFDFIKNVLDFNEQDEELLLSFFTEEIPENNPNKYTDDLPRIRYFGHACVLIESKNVSILFDPLISYKYDSSIDRYTYNDLPEIIDYILITHNHQDHCMLETLLQLRHKTKNVIVPKNNGGGLADPSLKLILENIGFKNVREIDELETIFIEDGSITGLPFLGEHADLNIRSKIAYSVILQHQTIWLIADSNNIEPKLYKHLHNFIGDIDVLFLGMECDGAPLSWLYGPLLIKTPPRKIDQSRRLDGSNYEKAIGIINQLHPKQVYVYAMGQEPWLTYLTSIQYTEESRPIIESNKLIEACKSQGIISERLFGKKEILLK